VKYPDSEDLFIEATNAGIFLWLWGALAGWDKVQSRSLLSLVADSNCKIGQHVAGAELQVIPAKAGHGTIQFSFDTPLGSITQVH